MRGHRNVTFNSGSPPRTVNGQPISQMFVLRMERPAYWTCWTRRECNCRPKTLMRKAIPITRSSPFYCTNRSLVDGRNSFLRLRKAEDPEAQGFSLPKSQLLRLAHPPHRLLRETNRPITGLKS